MAIKLKWLKKWTWTINILSIVYLFVCTFLFAQVFHHHAIDDDSGGVMVLLLLLIMLGTAAFTAIASATATSIISPAAINEWNKPIHWLQIFNISYLFGGYSRIISPAKSIEEFWFVVLSRARSIFNNGSVEIRNTAFGEQRIEQKLNKNMCSRVAHTWCQKSNRTTNITIWYNWG